QATSGIFPLSLHDALPISHRGAHRFAGQVVAGDADVVERGQLAEEADVLERPRHAQVRDGVRREPARVAAHDDDVPIAGRVDARSEEHTSELQSLAYLVCR